MQDTCIKRRAFMRGALRATLGVVAGAGIASALGSHADARTPHVASATLMGGNVTAVRAGESFATWQSGSPVAHASAMTTGGYCGGGIALVGDNGPELIYSAPLISTPLPRTNSDSLPI